MVLIFLFRLVLYLNYFVLENVAQEHRQGLTSFPTPVTAAKTFLYLNQDMQHLISIMYFT